MKQIHPSFLVNDFCAEQGAKKIAYRIWFNILVRKVTKDVRQLVVWCFDVSNTVLRSERHNKIGEA